jgi:hypothetical protein
MEANSRTLKWRIILMKASIMNFHPLLLSPKWGVRKKEYDSH